METKQCRKCGEIKPKGYEAFCAHPGTRDGYQPVCRVCANASSMAWARANREYVRSMRAAYRAKNAATIKACRAAYYAKNRKAIIEKALKWAHDNPGKSRANWAGHKAQKKKASAVPWANKFFIEEIYDLAGRRTKALGVPHHVDHIVPLRHPLVCGLHVEHNLRVIPGSINCSKGNRHWPDMPEKV